MPAARQKTSACGLPAFCIVQHAHPRASAMPRGEVHSSALRSLKTSRRVDMVDMVMGDDRSARHRRAPAGAS